MAANGFTPTTEQVCNAYAEDPVSEYYDPINYSANVAEARRSFYRWLAERDADTVALAQATIARMIADSRKGTPE